MIHDILSWLETERVIIHSLHILSAFLLNSQRQRVTWFLPLLGKIKQTTMLLLSNAKETKLVIGC